VTEIAERLGHSVKMLLAVYAAYIHGNTDTNKPRISAALDGALNGPETLVPSLWGDPVTSGNWLTQKRAEA